MNRPLEIGERIVVGGNLLPYAKAIVSERIFNVAQQRWGILLEWPDTPPELGPRPAYSTVWESDEGKRWVRFADAVKVN